MEAQQDNRKEENEDIRGNTQDPKDGELSIEDTPLRSSVRSRPIVNKRIIQTHSLSNTAIR